MKSDLFRSGFATHPVKSQWVPKQEGERLGFIVNLKEGTAKTNNSTAAQIGLLPIFQQNHCQKVGKSCWFNYLHEASLRTCGQNVDQGHLQSH